MTRKVILALAILSLVASVAMVGAVTTDAGRMESTVCTCSTVDVGSESVTLAVLADGTDGASVSQQVSQVNDHTRVRIDIEYSGKSVKIAGETVENGSLVLNVTRNGEVVNENVVANPDKTGTLVFHLESDGVRVSTGGDTPSECTCEGSVNVDDVDAIDADGADVADVDSANVAIEDDAVAASCPAVTDDSGVEVNVGEVEVNVGGDAVNSDESETCAKSSLDRASRPDGSPSARSAAVSGTASSVFRVVIRPTDVAELSSGIGDRQRSIGGLLSALGLERGTGDGS